MRATDQAFSPAGSGESLDGPNEVQIFDDLQKSKIDERAYRGVILQNGLRVMLVSDPSTNLSAVSLGVACGSSSDPSELPGLAHYVEHLLFLGTEKYPDANDYSNFISKHGGYQNAFTDLMKTNFYFTIDSAHLEPALDRYAQFFISPTFDAKYMEKIVEEKEASLSFRLNGLLATLWSVLSKVVVFSRLAGIMAYLKVAIGERLVGKSIESDEKLRESQKELSCDEVPKGAKISDVRELHRQLGQYSNPKRWPSIAAS